jgi:ribosomal protein S13
VLNTPPAGLTSNLFGLSLAFQNYLVSRFELIKFLFKTTKSLLYYDLNILKVINITLSKMTSINYPITELHTLTILRLYLIKTYQGKAHMLGKPVRGQRT